MNRILVLYGTTDGHTAKIAAFMGETLIRAGARVEVVEAGSEDDPNPAEFDGVVVAASLHAGGYQRAVSRWLLRHRASLAEKPTAMISVCLGVLQRDPAVWADLDAKVRRLFGQTGWRPGVVKFVAGAIPYSRYGWLKRIIMLHMSRKAGVRTDPNRDYEYTDWEDLRLFTEGFLRRVDARNPPACCVGPEARRSMSRSA